MVCSFDTDTKTLTLRLPLGEEVLIDEVRRLQIKAEDEAKLDATWRNDSVMFGASYEFVPLRLSQEERATLHVLEGMLDVSEYTDIVDVYHGMSLSMTGYRGFGYMGGLGYGSRGGGSGKNNAMKEGMMDCLSTLSGLELASSYKKGKQLIEEKSFADNAGYFQHSFEVARRHKIMNPGKMRATYGKMMWMLQDAQDRANHMGFPPVRGLTTVRSLLEDRGGLALLDDPLLPAATQFITAEGSVLVAEANAKKKAAVDGLVAQHQSATLRQDDINLVLNSIGDANAYLASNARPVAKMIQLLKKYFDPMSPGAHPLDLRSGRGGSKLSHSHATQYTFVLQSLTLWREITAAMYR